MKKILGAVIGLVLLLGLIGSCGASEDAVPLADSGETHSAAPKTAKQKAAEAKGKKAAAKKAAAKKAAAKKAAAKKAAAKQAAQVREDAKNTFDKCTEMNNTYPHGVGRPGARDHSSGPRVTNFKVSQHLYELNSGSDRDDDGIACEKL